MTNALSNLGKLTQDWLLGVGILARWIVSVLIGAIIGTVEGIWLIHNPIVAVLIGLNFTLTIALAKYTAVWMPAMWYVIFIGMLSGLSLSGSYQLRTGVAILVMSTGWSALSLISRRVISK